MAKQPKPPPENVLIYRLGSLGDTVVALPCFHLIRKAFPGSKITLLTNLPVSGVAAPAMSILENSGLCDQSISYPVGTRSLGELAEVRRIIRRIGPPLLINLAAARGLFKSLRDELFFRTCGIRRIIGTPLGRADLQIREFADGAFEQESQRLASRLTPLGAIELPDRQFWNLRLTPAERTQAAALMPSGRENFIAVGAGTKVPAKDWGEKNWANLLALLSLEIPDATLVIIGSAGEWERGENLGRAWKGAHLNFCGKTAPRISAAVLERCRLFIGHDSGPMHLAAAVGTPTLGLFSWHNPPGQWHPGHKTWKFIKTLYPPLPKGGWNPALRDLQGIAEGIRLLQPGDVLKAALELWRAHATRPAGLLAVLEKPCPAPSPSPILPEAGMSQMLV